MLAVKMTPEYLSFVQRSPKYAVKMPGAGREWRTKQKPLSDRPILAHLTGQYAVATVSPWYPSFGVIDIDDAPRNRVHDVLETIGFSDSNSMLCESESPNSYHVYFRPVYNDRPPTVRLLNDVFRQWAARKKVEIYPQATKCFRLPFGPTDKPIAADGGTLNMDVEQKLYWFNKLDEYDLAASPADKQLVLDLKVPEMPVCATTYKRGVELMEHGLQAPNSRHEAQFCILYSMWRQNYDINDAVNACFGVIKVKHNGYSKDLKSRPDQVLKEIVRQAARIWSDYDLARTYPDATHNLNHGYLTKPDLMEIIRVAEGNLPRIKFLGELVRYINPRQQRGAVSVHTERLIAWSGRRTYLKYLDEFAQKGIITRSETYIVGRSAKTIQLNNWQFQGPEKSVKADRRTTDTTGSIANSFAPAEFRERLQESGSQRTTSLMTVKAVFDHTPGNVLRFF